MDSEKWHDILMKGARKSGFPFARQQIDHFRLHAEELLQWNSKTNLTTITDPDEMAIKHFLDSVIPAGLVPSSSESMLDIGTGGGFPGLPLKVMLPHLDCTLIDASRKKISFVNQVIRKTGLESTRALHVRAQDLAGQAAYKHAFDVIVSRALSSLETVMRLSLPLWSTRGVIIAYRGSRKEEMDGWFDDIRRLATTDIVSETHRYVLPVVQAQRSVVLVRRRSPGKSPAASSAT